MPHLLHFLLDLCMHHCKLGCILHLSCAEATHRLQDAMSVGQCSRRVRAQLKRMMMAFVLWLLAAQSHSSDLT